MSFQTRPPASTPVDHERWQREREERDREDALAGRKFGDRYYSYDPRVTRSFSWLGNVASGVIILGVSATLALVLNMRESIAVIRSKPEPVSKEQYNQDQAMMREEMSQLRSDVRDIQIKQARALNENARP